MAAGGIPKVVDRIDVHRIDRSLLVVTEHDLGDD